MKNFIPISPKGTLFGRMAEQADEVLVSSYANLISRRHASITFKDDSWVIKDEGSLNGFLVNNVKRLNWILNDGDEVDFGSAGMMKDGEKRTSANKQYDLVFIFRDGPSPSLKKRKREDIEEEEEERERIKKQARLDAEAEAGMRSKAEIDEIRARLDEERARMNEDLRMARELAEAELKSIESKLAEETRSRIQKEAEAEAALASAAAEKSKHSSTMLEIEKLQQDLAVKDELVQRQLKAQEELEQKLATEKRAALKVDDLFEEFYCTICQEIMVDVLSLECGHQFCSKCLTTWLTKKADKDRVCPICRTKTKTGGSRNYTVDNLIEKVVDKMPEAEKNAFFVRKNPNAVPKKELGAIQPAASVTLPAEGPLVPVTRLASQDNSAPAAAVAPVANTPMQRLQQLLHVARERNFVFLRISEAWDAANRSSFARGIAPYVNDSAAKQLYCQAIGLTPGFVSTASPALLSRACQNLGYTAGGNAGQQRTWLTDFMTNPQIPPALASAANRAAIRIDL